MRKHHTLPPQTVNWEYVFPLEVITLFNNRGFLPSLGRIFDAIRYHQEIDPQATKPANLEELFKILDNMSLEGLIKIYIRDSEFVYQAKARLVKERFTAANQIR